MDLAAERGYPELLRQREAYWAALDRQERERALAVGQELYARYGDDVARPRLGHQLRRQAAKQTGVDAGATTILAMQPGAVTGKRANASADFEGDQ